MGLDNARVRQLLNIFDLTRLFIEELGWDRLTVSLTVEVEGETYSLLSVAEKRGVQIFQCCNEILPPYELRQKIDRQVRKLAHEHLIIFTDRAKSTQVWQWVSRQQGKPAAYREYQFFKNHSADALIARLNGLVFTLNDEEGLTITGVTIALKESLDREKVTKRFYDYFKQEHDEFMKFLSGIPIEADQRWYASVMLNRLMFIYFIQAKGFLNDDLNYLKNKLAESQKRGKDRFYRDFLCPLFFEGFAEPEANRSAKARSLLGQIPYLNGGIFQQHQLEKAHGKDIHIPDRAFQKLFGFFDNYRWHLDERPLRNQNEINPDILGYIFEKYINQKQMGAYYTKEDITEYISKNTIVPYLFDAAMPRCRIAFEGEHTIWQLLETDPDRYFYPAVRKGVELPLPVEIACGIGDVSKRTAWNKPAPDEYALPTEIWREVVARRQRYAEVRGKLASGEIRDINDLITYNLNIRQFAQDVIQYCEGPELLRAFWKAIEEVTILDPTCGSGAFLFAALNILEPLYEACLDRMQVFVGELDRSVEKHGPERFSDFRRILGRVEQHPNRRYFILKSIIVKNLFGVDIMEEAVEICKLRLFLKLVAQVDAADKIEPLPDIDFNIRAGNTLVGFATYNEVLRSAEGDLIKQQNVEAVKVRAADLQQAFYAFRVRQLDGDGTVPPEDKVQVKLRLDALNKELNHYLADEYGIRSTKTKEYGSWLESHQPFHWFVEFYGIIHNQGGFDIIIGNPPYVEYKEIRSTYVLRNFATEECSNLFAFVLERCTKLSRSGAEIGMIVPLSAFSTDRMIPLISHLHATSARLKVANFSWRPGRLFDGVNLQLAIVLQKVAKQVPEIETSRYLMWDSVARPELFSKIEYAVVTDNRLAGSIPKLGTYEAASILSKLRRHTKEIGTSFTRHSNNCVYYRRGGLYWKVFVDFETGSSEEKVIHLLPGIDRYGIIAALSSDLWWWYFTITSDCRHLGNRDIATFPFELREMIAEGQEALCGLGRAYVKDLKRNAEDAVRVYKGKKSVECLSFRVNQSKSIIDEIDRVLARHYEFSDDELDFIMNYDIKYRMGQDHEGEEG